MDLHSAKPFWLMRDGIIKNYTSLDGDRKVDVTIMGAGITGALVAWHLRKAGYNVLVADKGHIGAGSTSSSTSLLQYEIDTPLHKLVKLIGEQRAALSYTLCVKAIQDLQKICSELSFSEFELKESFQFASSHKDAKSLHEEYVLRKKHGIDLQWLSENDIALKFNFKAPAGLLSSVAAQTNAYSLTHALLKDIEGDGLEVCSNTEIIAHQYSANKIILTTSGGSKITADYLVVACGYESQKYIPKKIQTLNSTYAIISEPFVNPELWYKNALIWETAIPYLYLRTTPDNRIIIGGKDDTFYNPKKRDASLPAKAKSLQKSFNTLFPQLTFKTDFQWAGTFATTKDGLPYIGSIKKLPRTFFALGLGGNGITFSVLAAQIIRDAIANSENTFSTIFSFDR